MTTTRYPLAPLASALGVELLDAGWQADDIDPVILRGHQGIATACDVDIRTVQRWASAGIPERVADRLAAKVVGLWPAAIWGRSWIADEGEPDDGFPPLDDVVLDDACRSVAA